MLTKIRWNKRDTFAIRDAKSGEYPEVLLMFVPDTRRGFNIIFLCVRRRNTYRIFFNYYY